MNKKIEKALENLSIESGYPRYRMAFVYLQDCIEELQEEVQDRSETEASLARDLYDASEYIKELETEVQAKHLIILDQALELDALRVGMSDD